jgi:hypothetical protein
MSFPLKNPKAGPRTRVNVTLDSAIYPEARDRAHASGRSISDVISKLLQLWLSGKVRVDTDKDKP